MRINASCAPVDLFQPEFRPDCLKTMLQDLQMFYRLCKCSSELVSVLFSQPEITVTLDCGRRKERLPSRWYCWHFTGTGKLQLPHVFRSLCPISLCSLPSLSALVAGCCLSCSRQRTWRHWSSTWSTGPTGCSHSCGLRILLTEWSLWETKRKFRYVFLSAPPHGVWNSASRFRGSVM